MQDSLVKKGQGDYYSQNITLKLLLNYTGHTRKHLESLGDN